MARTSTALDLAGQKFGLLTAVERIGYRPGSRNLLWRCVCDCGVETQTLASSLRNGNTRSCGSGKHWTADKGPRQLILALRSAQNGAKKRGIEWALSNEQFIELACQPCFYCGRGGAPRGSGLYDMVEASGVDRFDNSQGYTVSNSVPCCRMCNAAKSTLTAEQFVAHCLAVAHRILKHHDH